jgi:hypothetical protein
MRVYPGLFPWVMDGFTPSEWEDVQKDLRDLERAQREA